MTSFVVVGSVFRTVTTDDWFVYTAHVCSILNGIAGATIMSAPPALAAAWFPESERIFATSVSQVSTIYKEMEMVSTQSKLFTTYIGLQGFNIMGSGVSYLIGPPLVPYDDNLDPENATWSEIEATRKDIQYYMIGDAVVAGIILLLIIIYFPSKVYYIRKIVLYLDIMFLLRKIYGRNELMK